MAIKITQIQWRRGTSAEWDAANPILAAGEPGFVLDTGLYKIGDGTTAWTSLPYANTGEGGGVSDHGLLTGRLDDDHTQYHTDARGDVRYYRKTEVDVALSNKENTGVAAAAVTGHEATHAPSDAITEADHALIDHTGLPGVGAGGGGGVTDHGALTGLADDDHTQYHTDARGDARYYLKSQVDSAVATKENTGVAATVVSNHHAPTSTDHDDRYYTEAEMDAALAGKENTGVAATALTAHHGPASTDHDDRYTPSASLADVATSGAYADLTGAPSLASVATTGAYSDLSGTPTLGTAADNAETDFATAAQGLLAASSVQQDNTYATAVNKIMPLTQVQYDAIGTPSDDTLYLIVG